MVSEKEKLNRALNYYLSGPSGALNTLITCELGWGEGIWSRKLRKIGETLLSSLPNFFEIEARRGDF